MSGGQQVKKCMDENDDDHEVDNGIRIDDISNTLPSHIKLDINSIVYPRISI